MGRDSGSFGSLATRRSATSTRMSVILKVLPADEARAAHSVEPIDARAARYESGGWRRSRMPCARRVSCDTLDRPADTICGRGPWTRRCVWSLSDYAHAARHLGRFNGAYLKERALPAADWLSRNWLRRGWRKRRGCDR